MLIVNRSFFVVSIFYLSHINSFPITDHSLKKNETPFYPEYACLGNHGLKACIGCSDRCITELFSTGMKCYNDMVQIDG